MKTSPTANRRRWRVEDSREGLAVLVEILADGEPPALVRHRRNACTFSLSVEILADGEPPALVDALTGLIDRPVRVEILADGEPPALGSCAR